MYATKIKMCSGCSSSLSCQDIDSIYLEGVTKPDFYKKEVLYDFLIKNPDTITVNLGSRPNLKPAVSPRRTKYVRSESNDTEQDNLLKLPRE